MKRAITTAGYRGPFLWTARLDLIRVAVLGLTIAFLSAIALTVSLNASTPVNASGTCRADTDYTLPQTVDLSSASNPLTVVDDDVSVYGVGGSTVEGIRSALDTCAPSFMDSAGSGEYLAYTSYALNWNYQTVANGSSCRLTNVKVGLRVSQLEPMLLNPSGVDSAIDAKWKTFMNGLKNHEDGHKRIDIAYAASLLQSLKTIVGPCRSINESLNTVTANAVQSIVAANAKHDKDTDFGKTQNAVW